MESLLSVESRPQNVELGKSYQQDRINTQEISRFALAQVECRIKLMFYLTIVNKIFRHCHFSLAQSSRQRIKSLDMMTTFIADILV